MIVIMTFWLWKFLIPNSDPNKESTVIIKQGRSLTMGREGLPQPPPLRFLAQNVENLGLAPSTFSD